MTESNDYQYTETELRRSYTRSLTQDKRSSIEFHKLAELFESNGYRGNGYDTTQPFVSLPRTSRDKLVTSKAIDKMITLRETQEGPTRVADIGYGSGFALIEAACMTNWKGKIELFGLGPSDYARRIWARNVNAYNLLIDHDITLREIDAKYINEVDLPKFHIILACNSIQYMRSSHMKLIRLFYDQLEKGGFMSITGFGRIYDPSTNLTERNPDYFSSNGLRPEWRNYFKALQQIGCFIDISEYSGTFGLVIYKEQDIPIPNIINGIERPGNSEYYY